MASLLEGEKELFEKFWRGTFKAVAMPRPESVIIASIAARRAVTKLETTVGLATKPSEANPESEGPPVKTMERKRRVKHRGHKRHSRRHVRSVSFEGDISPWPMAKRKTKKKSSKRKRRRERSRPASPSPVRKKRKKKKSSRKRTRHRSASKKTQHSTSNNRRKRKDDRKHKKRSQSYSHHRHRSRRADDRSPGRRSLSTQNRSEDQSSSPLGDKRRLVWGTAVKLAKRPSSRCCALTSDCSVSCSHSGHEALNNTAIVQNSLSNQVKGHADYDSGNDTSSPPSTKTGITRTKVKGGRKVLCQELASLEKLRFTNRDNASDSGNSLTSYDSACEVIQAEKSLPRSALRSIKREESRSCAAFMTLQPTVTAEAARSLTPSRNRYRPRSRSRSSRSSRVRDSYSRSRSLSSSHRSYCRSSSYSLDSRRSSVCSGNSGRSEKRSRHMAVRGHQRKRARSSGRKQLKQDRKGRRRRFSSPMRKRRRGSPSHLEARRITSARKRPIPYYRPSPSSSSSPSSRCSSLSPWSLFSLSRSRSPSRNRSSYRSYSHASSWSSAYSSRSRSRSRSYESLASYSRARR